MKYRIRTIPGINSHPDTFRIEALYLKETFWSRLGFVGFEAKWVYVDKFGEPIILVTGRPCTQNVLHPLNSLKSAKLFLNEIKEYKAAKSKVVFEVEL